MMFPKTTISMAMILVIVIFAIPAHARIDAGIPNLLTFDDMPVGTSMTQYGFDEIGAAGATGDINNELFGNHFSGPTAGGGSQVLRAFFDNIGPNDSVKLSAVLDDWSGNSSFGWGSVNPTTQVNAGPKSGGWGFNHEGSIGGTIDTNQPFLIEYTVHFVNGSSSTYDVRYEQPLGDTTYEFAGIKNPLQDLITSDNFGARIFIQSGGGDFDDMYVGPPGAGTQPVPAKNFTWGIDASGDWNVKDNWNRDGTGTFPNAPNHTATFGSVITAQQFAFTNEHVTVNSITFDSVETYGIGGLGSVNLTDTTEPDPVSPTMSVLQGSHEFQAAVNFRNGATVDVAADSELTFNNALNLLGNAVTKTGTGTITVNNRLNTGGGDLTVQEGTLSGNGTVGGNTSNTGGTIAPGNSPGVLTVDGDFNNGSGGTIAIEIEGTGGAGKADGHDQIQVTGSSTLAGTLDITTGAYADPTTRATRESFTLISSAGGSTGTFDTVNYNGTELNGSHQGNGLFRNVAYGDNDVSLDNLLALEGDADGDADIDITDFNVLAANFDSAGANAETNNWTTADFDSDGDVDITDFNFLAANFADSGYLAPANNQVPEPGTLILLLIGAAFVWTWQSLRRR